MTKIKIISLDLFETLVHFKSELFDSRIVLNQAFENHPDAPPVPFERVYSKYREVVRAKMQDFEEELEFRNEEILVEIRKENQIRVDSKLEEMALSIMTDYFSSVTSLIEPITGVYDTLETYRSFGHKLILLSNHSFAGNGFEIMSKLKLADFFSQMVFSAELGYKKPSSKIFDMIKTTFPNHNMEEVVHIGDDIRTDVYGALKYGIKAVWIENSKYKDLEAVIQDHPNYLGSISSIQNASKILGIN